MGSTRPPVGVALPLVATVALLVGCGGGDGADRTSSPTSANAGGAAGARKVTIHDYTYEPAEIAVPIGTPVTFVNRDSTPHTATAKEPGGFESGSLKTSESGQVTLDEAGTFAYYCLFHPFMKGTVTVE